MQYKIGGIFHRRLNINEKPIVNKYCEGKLKRTLKKEFKEFEVVNLELIYYNMRYQSVLTRLKIDIILIIIYNNIKNNKIIIINDFLKVFNKIYFIKNNN